MNSIWQDDPFGKEYDLIVVGAGIVGLHAALFFKRKNPNKSVCVIEKGSFSSGASIKNAGFACFGSPTELLDDIEKEGEDATVRRVVMRWEGLQGLRNELGDGSIGIVEDDGFELFLPDSELHKACKHSFGHLNELLYPIFKTHVYSWDDAIISNMGMRKVQHAARIQFEASIHTGKMMRMLWGKTIAEGVEIRVNTEVKAIMELPNAVQLETQNGNMRSEQIILATNAYTNRLIPELDLVPGRGQILLTSVIPGLSLKGEHHLEKGYFYFRPYGDRVLIGEADI